VTYTHVYTHDCHVVRHFHRSLLQGHVRKHKDCFLSGKPCHESSFDPKAAARSVPSTLTIRVLVGATTKKPITFFLLSDVVLAQARASAQAQIKLMEAAVHNMPNAGPCEFRFVPDPTARSGTKRKLPPGAGSESTSFEVELATNESSGNLWLDVAAVVVLFLLCIDC
jgi:hypothetical protein